MSMTSDDGGIDANQTEFTSARSLSLSLYGLPRHILISGMPVELPRWPLRKYQLAKYRRAGRSN